MKGRKPDPNRARRGTGHRTVKSAEVMSAEVVAVAGDPAPPAAFAPDPAWPEPVREIFATAVAELYPRGLREADLEALRMLATAAHRHRAAAAKVEEFGVLVQGRNGPMVNPMLKVERDMAATFQRLAAEYGLTVGARVRYGLMQLAGQSMLRQLNDDLDG